MDAYEATRVVYSRIQALDPENAAKIISLLLVQDHGDKEMIRLAFGPETLLHSLVLKARNDLGLLSSTASPRLPPSPAPAWPFSDGGDPFCQELADDTYWGTAGNHQGFLGADHLPGLWRPCLYYARGFCKNGDICRFLHGEDGGKMDAALEQELLLRSRSPRLGSQLAASAFPFSPNGGAPASPAPSRDMNFLLQQNSTQRSAVAAMMLAGGEEARRQRSDYAGIANPVSRQIYLTFPAESTFREEDVSNYFSIYGPVQDVRIPYQQKRMFGFVTFVYPDTVKLILAKGNPHFVCDARVLVKPYKEKGKVPDKYRKLQQLQIDGLDFSGCLASPTMDRDPYDLQHLGARTMYNGGSGQEMLLRRKLEEQKQAVELQQAIELQGRRFMSLQLMDLKTRSLPSPIGTGRYSPNSFFSTHDHSSEHSSSPEDKSPSSDTASIAAAYTALSPDRLLSSSSSNRSSNTELLQHPAMAAAAAAAADKDESAAETSSHEDSSDFHESVEHNLPDSPFASPRKAAGDAFSTNSSASNSDLVAAFSYHDRRNHFIGAAASPRLPASSFDMAPCNPGFFQMPRLSAGHGAIGM